jgi:hypothetical protein
MNVPLAVLHNNMDCFVSENYVVVRRNVMDMCRYLVTLIEYSDTLYCNDDINTAMRNNCTYVLHIKLIFTRAKRAYYDICTNVRTLQSCRDVCPASSEVLQQQRNKFIMAKLQGLYTACTMMHPAGCCS